MAVMQEPVEHGRHQGGVAGEHLLPAGEGEVGGQDHRAAAIQKVLNGSTWQRCRVHTTRNLLARVPKAQQSRLAALLREAFTAPNAEKAHAAWRAVADAARETHLKLAEAMD